MLGNVHKYVFLNDYEGEKISLHNRDVVSREMIERKLSENNFKKRR